ncbi:NUDCD1 isoform 4 [Pan troglodytes]|uniref:NudC domain containing 1 n=2 Tax=Homininae TaxID=207598 RepID=E5RHQ3_HUMAN|nr:NudC domain containing 1 [Homo sapiens]KAI4011694.1 NudC domain containing 1 [Homo sapiens]PNI85415.1 NUDCD1 isoform 4 [Pan troglodytes]
MLYLQGWSMPAVAEVKLRDDQYTLEHMHAFGMYNYLHCDSWYQDSVYYIDTLGRIMNLTVMLILKYLNHSIGYCTHLSD